MRSNEILRFPVVLGLAFTLLAGCAPPAEEPLVPADEQVPAEPAAPPATPPATTPAEAPPMTLTGCLERSEEPGVEYTLTVTEAVQAVSPGARYRLMPQPGVDLDAHVSHTVRITGTEDQAQTLRVQSMEHVSPQCEPPTTE